MVFFYFMQDYQVTDKIGCYSKWMDKYFKFAKIGN